MRPPRCSMTDAEFQERQKARGEEISAVSEAIAILSDDSAKDLYSKTLGFVQKKDARSKAVRAGGILPENPEVLRYHFTGPPARSARIETEGACHQRGRPRNPGFDLRGELRPRLPQTAAFARWPLRSGPAAQGRGEEVRQHRARGARDDGPARRLHEGALAVERTGTPRSVGTCIQL